MGESEQLAAAGLEVSSARISSLKILVGALAIVPLRFSVFAGAVAIPFVLCLCFDSIWLMQSAVDLYHRLLWLMLPLTQLIDLILYTIVAVAIHRVVLLGPSSVRRYRLEWAAHTTRFLTFAILLASAGYAAALVIFRVFEGAFLKAFASFVVIYVLARLLLVFPAAAVGRPISFMDSWKLTRHRKLLMVLIAIVYPTVIELPMALIPDSSTVYYLVRSVLAMVTLIVTVILLSFAYQQIGKEHADAV